MCTTCSKQCVYVLVQVTHLQAVCVVLDSMLVGVPNSLWFATSASAITHSVYCFSLCDSLPCCCYKAH